MTTLCEAQDRARLFARQPAPQTSVRALATRLFESLRAILAAPGAAHRHGDPWIAARRKLGDMDEHMLRDIGAPPWLITETLGRREAELRRLQDRLHF